MFVPNTSAMPNSKLGFYRYMLIDRMLASKQKPFPTKEELLEACHEKFGVRSVSTIEKDLAAMRLEFDAPISYHVRMRGYYYEDPSFKLFGLHLEEQHVQALDFAEIMLEGVRYLPFFEEFSDAVDKVLDGLEMSRSFTKDQKRLKNWIQFEKPGYHRGSETLSALVKHIADKQPIDLQYKKFGAAEGKHYSLHPYLIKEDSGYWYMIGYVEEYDQIRTFGIDRIEGFELVNLTFTEPEEVGFDRENYFSHCFGVTVMDGQPEETILSFTPQQGNYLKTQPIHPLQEILVDDEREFRIRLVLVNNYELRSKILGYGAAVKVLSPDSLKLSVQKELAKALSSY